MTSPALTSRSMRPGMDPTEAAALRFHTCYLETLTSMTAAQALDRSMGLAPRPTGNTGRFGCDRWHARPPGPGAGR
jgi:hypothetical protein